ncbi:MAG: ATP synthase F0 subunit B [Bdellovibrionaceae bacterium]|nr:ATP synthase F0 subunit B [Pseudobdellovibrionaceae bacterium]
MELLTALGVDSTLAIHLACFLVSYLALSHLIFKPYLRAYEEREHRTIGNEEHAVRLIQETATLQTQYEQAAKGLNAQIKSAFDRSRTAAQKDYENLVQTAREQAQKTLEASRERLTKEIEATRKALAAEIPAVSAAIASKLAGKDLSQ